jgi:uncharacterized protein YutE (UPF0331/DUF86 family)
MNTATPFTLPLLDALAQKAARLARCVARVREEFAATADFSHDFSRQDAAILNIQRACEQAIDMGTMVISHHQLGMPRSAKDVFVVLHDHALIGAPMAKSLQGMVGFRNIAVHEYDALDMGVVLSVITERLDDLLEFAATVLRHAQPPSPPSASS